VNAEAFAPGSTPGKDIRLLHIVECLTKTATSHSVRFSLISQITNFPVAPYTGNLAFDESPALPFDFVSDSR